MLKAPLWARAALLASALVVQSAQAASPIAKGAVILLQPESVVGRRIESVDAMAGYITAVFVALDKRLATTAGPASAGSIFIALHGGKRTHVWIGAEPDLAPDLAAALRDAVAAVPGFAVRGGTVVFALNVGLWGGTPPAGRTGPLPDAWRAAAATSGKPHPEAADLADLAWAAESKTKAKPAR